MTGFLKVQIISILLFHVVFIDSQSLSTTTDDNTDDPTQTTNYISYGERRLMDFLNKEMHTGQYIDRHVPKSLISHTDQLVRFLIQEFEMMASNERESRDNKPESESKWSISFLFTKLKKSFFDTLQRFIRPFNGIYPGTLWCGAGNIAVDKTDVGFVESLDTCCRAHDSCEYNIPGYTKRFGLHNKGLITRSHCDCEKKFYSCLQDDYSEDYDSSLLIGFLYFDWFRPRCFKFNCIKYNNDGTCATYDYHKAFWVEGMQFIDEINGTLLELSITLHEPNEKNEKNEKN